MPTPSLEGRSFRAGRPQHVDLELALIRAESPHQAEDHGLGNQDRVILGTEVSFRLLLLALRQRDEPGGQGNGEGKGAQDRH